MSDPAPRSRSPDVTDWEQLEALFVDALDVPERERDGWIADRCDAAMAVELRSLLMHAGDAPLVGAIAAAMDELAVAPRARIGPYRLGALIGEGGMGSVYGATRDDAEFAREVAIKILRPFPSQDHVARFRDERQILATLDHPAIVRLLDGGRTDDDLPYLVMERIDGVPITTYVRGRPIRERVELIARVAEAVGYAHGTLVVHRDLKPSNILVVASGAPKLLDFGIAKLLGGERETPETRSGMAMLTPEYASPEQARGEPITVATDVYSLGAVFYEVLTGRPPQTAGASVVDTLTAICERRPARPNVSGDLDSIVLKALEKRPADRYASIADLIADLERYLDGRPVLARAATARYRAGKFVRRHAGKLALTTVIAGALTTAAVVAIVQARRATEQAALADTERTQLVFERGWQELASGRAGAALPWLVRALAEADTAATRFLLAEALRPFEREIAVVPFPRGANEGRWLSADRFALWGRGGFAIFDGTGHRIGDELTAPVSAIAAMPDGGLAIAADHAVIVRDAAGKPLHELPSTPYARVACTLEGTLVIVEMSGRLRIVRDGRVLIERTLDAIAVAADRDRIALGTGGGKLIVLDGAGTERLAIDAHARGIGAVRFAAGGRIVTASADATAKVWSERGELQHVFAGHNSLVESIAVDRAGLRVATGGRDGTAKVWSIEQGRFVVEVRGHEFGTGVDFSPDGTSLLTTGGDYTHRIWDLQSAHLTMQYEARIGGGSASSARAGSLAAFYDPTGTRVLAVAGASAKILRVDRGALLAELDSGRSMQPRSAAFGPGEREVAIVGVAQFEIWDVRANARIATMPISTLLWDVAWSPDGTKLAIAGVERASLVDRATLKETPLVGHAGRVTRVQFSGTRIVTAAGDRTARIWDAASGRMLATLDHPASVASAIWDRTGARILTTCSDGKIRIWNATTHVLADTIDAGTRFLDLALAPDENLLALAAHDGTIAIWDLAARRRVLSAAAHTGPVTGIAWSPDGALLATSADDQTARIWDPRTGKVLATRRHRDGAMSVAWRADGTAILTASTDGSVRIWDARREQRSLADLRALVERLVP